MFSKLRNILIPTNNISLGRWKLKHNPCVCENYIQNYHPEPGYPNNFKKYWKLYDKSNTYEKKT